MTDTRIAYGARCTWWGPIQEVGTRPPHGLPCCPICHGMLFEEESEAQWLAGAQAYQDDGHPGYLAMVQWLKGQCFANYDLAAAAYALQQQIH